MKRGQTSIDAPARSDGPLTTAEQAAAYRARGLPLAYDPVQIGWVPADCADDIDITFKPIPGPRYAKLLTDDGSSYALRPWRPSDIEVFHQLLNDAEVWRFMPEDYPAPLSLADAADLIEVSRLSNHHEVRSVMHRGTPIGQVRLEFDMTTSETAELSYWMGRPHWGKGHGQQMVKHYVERSFADHPSLRQITARFRPQNQASSRILVRAGFSKRLRQATPGWTWMDKTR